MGMYICSAGIGGFPGPIMLRRKENVRISPCSSTVASSPVSALSHYLSSIAYDLILQKTPCFMGKMGLDPGQARSQTAGRGGVKGGFTASAYLCCLRSSAAHMQPRETAAIPGEGAGSRSWVRSWGPSLMPRYVCIHTYVFYINRPLMKCNFFMPNTSQEYSTIGTGLSSIKMR